MIKLTKKQLEDLLSGLIPITLNYLQGMLGVYKVHLVPKPETPFYLCDEHGAPADLILPLDAGIGVPTLINQSWDHSSRANYNKIAQRIDAPGLTLIDIGANVGLFSRQMKASMGNKLSRIVCYEPHPVN